MGVRPGIRDIAEKAGVSVATVSLALRDKGRISAATRERIKEIADREGYAPNSSARRLVGSRTGLIAITMPAISDVPEVVGSIQYFVRLLGAAAAAALELDYGLVISPAPDVRRPTAVDGAIVVDPALDDPSLAAFDRTGTPVVTIGRRLEAAPATTRAWAIDNDFGAATMRTLDHLHENGSRSPALLASHPIDSFQQDSIDAYTEWCEERGIEPRIVVSESPLDPDALDAATRMIEEHRPDGVYATIDTLARALLDRAAETGVGVPADLRLATCSDSEICRISRPPLTTIDERPVELGTAAVRLLIAAIDDPDATPETVQVETELLVRDSTMQIEPRGEGAGSPTPSPR